MAQLQALRQVLKCVPVEVVEYDDRSNNEEAVRAVERLVTQDKSYPIGSQDLAPRLKQVTGHRRPAAFPGLKV
jgi:hypothetical protein